MDEEIKSWLFDIINSIEEINSFFNESNRNFSSFKNSVLIKRGVERNLEIIGEAVSRIAKKDSSFKISNARKIIDTRNRIIHSYDNVSDDIIWSIIIKHLPELEEEVNLLLK
jgi:uncharacterized protein with HEPN domain